MSSPRYAALARKLLVRRDVAMEVPAPDFRERAASIAAIELAIQGAARRRRLLRWGTGAATAAAAVLCALGAGRWASHRAGSASLVGFVGSASPDALQIVAHAAAGGASLVGPQGEAPLLDGRSLPSGSRIVTPPNGQATLSFSTGTTASLGSGADLSIEEQSGSQILHLAGGSVDLHVAKLTTGRRFLVDTVDTEVEVRGTQFRVELADPSPACGDGVLTRVSVTEGVVAVRHAGVEARVGAGETWPKGCAPLAAAGPDGSHGYAGPRGTPVVQAQGHWGRGAHGPASDLAGQNDLFIEGTQAWHRGDGQAALGAFDQLLGRYPSGQLAENACVQRMRVLRSIAPERAASSARDYLGRYPSGFARAEAEAVLQAGSP